MSAVVPPLAPSALAAVPSVDDRSSSVVVKRGEDLGVARVCVTVHYDSHLQNATVFLNKIVSWLSERAENAELLRTVQPGDYIGSVRAAGAVATLKPSSRTPDFVDLRLTGLRSLPDAAELCEVISQLKLRNMRIRRDKATRVARFTEHPTAPSTGVTSLEVNALSLYLADGIDQEEYNVENKASLLVSDAVLTALRGSGIKEVRLPACCFWNLAPEEVARIFIRLRRADVHNLWIGNKLTSIVAGDLNSLVGRGLVATQHKVASDFNVEQSFNSDPVRKHANQAGWARWISALITFVLFVLILSIPPYALLVYFFMVALVMTVSILVATMSMVRGEGAASLLDEQARVFNLMVSEASATALGLIASLDSPSAGGVGVKRVSDGAGSGEEQEDIIEDLADSRVAASAAGVGAGGAAAAAAVACARADAEAVAARARVAARRRGGEEDEEEEKEEQRARVTGSGYSSDLNNG